LQLPSSRKKVNRLLELVEQCPRILICTHDNPDPDSMAAAMTLSHLLESTSAAKPRIVYGGLVGRAENRNMVRILDIPLWSQESIKVREDDGFIVVDTQPAFGNNSVPEDANIIAVLDHHESTRPVNAPLVDIRTDYGAVTTVAAEYLVASGVSIPGPLATAICYGISTETQDLGREASPADIAAYVEVFPMANQPLLGKLHNPRRPVSFFANLSRAIEATRLAETVAVCHLESLSTPDLAAEIADMLLTIEDMEWVLCSGRYGESLIMSVRTDDPGARAGELLRRVVGERSRAGGHGMIAGGSVQIRPREAIGPIQEELEQRFLEELGLDEARLTPLVDQPGVPPTDTPR
jgi:nanoRNase/pAp phosphatase (c-di-AMP/oligoRNAs hydrolase)